MFSILDVMWMMLCFFGMRRRYSSSRGVGTIHHPTSSYSGTMRALIRALACRGLDGSGSWVGVDVGNAAIYVVTITHLIASLVLAPNVLEDGCRISLPCLGCVVVDVGIVLWGVMKGGKFLPDDQRRRIQGPHVC